MAEKTASSLMLESGLAPSFAQADVVSQNSSSKSELVNEVFSLFKGYLTSQLEEKGKQFERSAKSYKEATDIKYKGNRKYNRKQLEVNLQLDNILTRIDDSTSSPADKNRDGWLVVQEYESDDLASDSEDEKKIHKAKAATEKKRKQAKSNSGNTSKKFKSSRDFQLFCGKTIVYFYFVKFLVLWLDCLRIQPSSCCIYLFMFFKEENNLRSSEPSELERN